MANLEHLDEAITKVEFKLTVLASEEHKIEALLRERRPRPQRRSVYFYDTKDLDLKQRDMFLRARITEGEGDSTVKLRDIELPDPGADWRQVDEHRVELDVVGERHIPSVKVDGTPKAGEIEDVEEGKDRPGSLFGAEQKQLFAARAPDGLELDDLEIMGPVDARKWELEPTDEFAFDLAVERWELPDASRFIELSFKVKPGKAPAAETAFNAFLAARAIDPDGDPDPKTPRVLDFFAARLG